MSAPIGGFPPHVGKALGGAAALEWAILVELDRAGPDWCLNLKGLQEALVVPKPILHGVVTELRNKQFAEYRRGLWTDGGQPAGAGYAITAAGKAALSDYEADHGRV